VVREVMKQQWHPEHTQTYRLLQLVDILIYYESYTEELMTVLNTGNDKILN
jgi:hypothetical protein